LTQLQNTTVTGQTVNSTTYTRDRIGNSLTDIRTGSATGTVYESYGYDDNGGLTSIAGSRTLALTWDANNRVKQINSNTFNYDPSGYRIKKTGSANNNYYLEGEHLEAIYDNTGTVQVKYLRGSVIDEIVNGYQLDSTGKLVNTTYHHDALQSVLGQSGHEGSILTTQSYSVFGSILSQTGASNNAQKYTGREIDSETGFYYYRARYYDAVTGRFISEDPKGFGAGINFYAYVNNNPVNYNDPSGFLTSFLWGASNISQEAIGIGSFGNQVAMTGTIGAASAPLASLAAAGASSVAPLVNGMALTNGLISGASSAVGSLALGGNTQNALISGGAGFLAGYVSPFLFTPSFLRMLGKGSL